MKIVGRPLQERHALPSPHTQVVEDSDMFAPEDILTRQREPQRAPRRRQLLREGKRAGIDGRARGNPGRAHAEQDRLWGRIGRQGHRMPSGVPLAHRQVWCSHQKSSHVERHPGTGILDGHMGISGLPIYDPHLINKAQTTDRKEHGAMLIETILGCPRLLPGKVPKGHTRKHRQDYRCSRRDPGSQRDRIDAQHPLGSPIVITEHLEELFARPAPIGPVHQDGLKGPMIERLQSSPEALRGRR